jgi:histidine triad (HIT) family protein
MTTELERSIFTKIINREIPADIIFENEAVIAFLTIEPITAGHTLVVPKVAFRNIFDADEKLLSDMMSVAKLISTALVAAGLADGVNLIMNNGASAGQEVFHAHLHIVPRIQDDHALVTPMHVTYEQNQAAAIAETIAQHVR